MNQIPYDCDGNLLGYPSYHCWKYHPGDDISGLDLPTEDHFISKVPGRQRSHGAIWEDNEPFWTRLSFKGFSRGRSSAVFLWESHENKTYQMFMTDMDRLIKNADITAGKTDRLEWIISKRGTNYGISLVL